MASSIFIDSPSFKNFTFVKSWFSFARWVESNDIPKSDLGEIKLFAFSLFPNIISEMAFNTIGLTVPLRSSTSEIINLASIAAYSSEVIEY